MRRFRVYEISVSLDGDAKCKSYTKYWNVKYTAKIKATDCKVKIVVDEEEPDAINEVENFVKKISKNAWNYGSISLLKLAYDIAASLGCRGGWIPSVEAKVKDVSKYEGMSRWKDIYHFEAIVY